MNFNWQPDWDRAVAQFANEEGLLYHANGMIPSVRPGISAPPHPTPVDVTRLMDEEELTAAAWVFHPARRDKYSDQFHADPDRPSNRVAKARDKEYRFLSSPQSIEPFLCSRELELLRYDQLMKKPAFAGH
jgi:hypothetical protein